MTEALLLDEHFPPVLASLLRAEGFDVVSVSESTALRGVSDDEVYKAAIEQGRRIVTENVRDFRPLLSAALSDGTPCAPLLLTTPKRHPRRSGALGALVADLCTWLGQGDSPRQIEEWL